MKIGVSMDRYSDCSPSTIGKFIGQMAIEMEKKADECKALQSELAKKDSQLVKMSRRIEALEEECRSFRQDLVCAQEERTKIASILGLEDSGGAAVRMPREMVPAHAQAPMSRTDGGRPAAEADLAEYAAATLERMRRLNR